MKPAFAAAALAAACTVVAALPAGAAVVVDTFTATDGTVTYPMTDTVRGVAMPASDLAPGVFGGLRTTVVGALPLPPVGSLDSYDGEVASLNLATAVGMINATSTSGVSVGTILAYSAPFATPADVDLSGEDRFVIAYTASDALTLQLTASNTSANNSRQTAGSRTPVLTLPAGSGTFEVLFSQLTEEVRVPFGGQIVPLPSVDFASVDSLVFDFNGTAEGQSFAFTNVAAVPEPTTLGLAGAAGLCLLRRRRT